MFKEFFSLIKESIIEHVKHRLFVVTVLFLVLFGILIYRLFDLQIVNGEKYQESFTYKSVKTVAEKRPGEIYTIVTESFWLITKHPILYLI